MKALHSHKLIYLLLFSLVNVISCHAQEVTNTQKGSNVESKKQGKHPKIRKTLAMEAHENIFCSLLDKSGKLWFGTTGAGVYCYDGETFTNYTTNDGMNHNSIWSVIEDKAGNILFGTGEGISRYDGTSFTNITKNTDLSHSSISSMLEDSKGRLWVCDYRFGNYKNAVYLHDPNAQNTDGEMFTNFLSRSGVKNDGGLKLLRTNAMAEDTTGNIWFADQNREVVSFYDGESLIPHKPSEELGIHKSVYRSMLLDKKGTFWLGTHGHGVQSFVPSMDKKGKKILPPEKGELINITENTGASESVVMSILEDRNGNLWFCTDGEGVWRYDGKSLKNFNTEDGLLNNSVFSVVEDKEGNLWFGTRDVGLYRYDGKSFVSFSE